MTVDDNTKVEVRNLVGHETGYSVPELHVKRRFEPFETKKIEADELRKLHYRRGGRIMLHDYLCVMNDELRQEFDIPADQIEYDWTADDVKNLLLSGDDDTLRDALDFGPAGIVELIERMAFDMKIPDINKREIIKEMTGKDVNKQIELKSQEEIRLAQDRGEQSIENTPKRRRSSDTSTKQRRRKVQ